MKKGESQTLTATVNPSDATDKAVTWKSSNPAAATIDGGKVTAVAAGKATITAEDLAALKETYHMFCFDILGLQEDKTSNAGREEAFAGAVNLLLAERQEAKANKDWAKSDRIRNELAALGFEIKDGKNGAEWKLNK